VSLQKYHFCLRLSKGKLTWYPFPAFFCLFRRKRMKKDEKVRKLTCPKIPFCPSGQVRYPFRDIRFKFSKVKLVSLGKL